MKTLSLILSLILITTNAYAEWTFYSSDDKGNVRFYDKSTIKRNGDKVKVWMYFNMLADDKSWESLNTKSMRTLVEIDCVNETHKPLSIQRFTELDLEGDMTDVPITNRPIIYIVPNSSHATLMKLVCKK